MNLNQLITSTTHHKPNCKPSLIDPVLTRYPDSVFNIKHHPPVAKSHHQVISLKIKTNCLAKSGNKSKTEKIKKPNFDKANYQAINNFLQEINWDEELKDKNVDEMWDIIKLNINKAQELFVPYKIINNNKIKTNHVAMDDTLHYLLKEKRYAFKLYKKHNSKKNMYKYNLARNKVSTKIKQMKKDKENIIAKNIKINPKAFYQYIASKTLVKEGVHELINENGKLTNVDEEKCNILNKFSALFLQMKMTLTYLLLIMIIVFHPFKSVLLL